MLSWEHDDDGGDDDDDDAAADADDPYRSVVTSMDFPCLFAGFNI